LNSSVNRIIGIDSRTKLINVDGIEVKL